MYFKIMNTVMNIHNFIRAPWYREQTVSNILRDMLTRYIYSNRGPKLKKKKKINVRQEHIYPQNESFTPAITPPPQYDRLPPFPPFFFFFFLPKHGNHISFTLFHITPVSKVSVLLPTIYSINIINATKIPLAAQKCACV